MSIKSSAATVSSEARMKALSQDKVRWVVTVLWFLKCSHRVADPWGHHVHRTYQIVPPSSVTTLPSRHFCKEHSRRGLSLGDLGYWTVVGSYLFVCTCHMYDVCAWMCSCVHMYVHAQKCAHLCVCWNQRTTLDVIFLRDHPPVSPTPSLSWRRKPMNSQVPLFKKKKK